MKQRVPDLFSTQLESWTKHMKQLFSDIGQQAAQNCESWKEGGKGSEPCDHLGFLPVSHFALATQRGESQAKHRGLSESKRHRGSYVEIEEAIIGQTKFQRGKRYIDNQCQESV